LRAIGNRPAFSLEFDQEILADADDEDILGGDGDNDWD